MSSEHAVVSFTCTVVCASQRALLSGCASSGKREQCSPSLRSAPSQGHSDYQELKGNELGLGSNSLVPELKLLFPLFSLT